MLVSDTHRNQPGGGCFIVLILVLVDVGLGRGVPLTRPVHKGAVLILVLVDVGLGPMVILP